MNITIYTILFFFFFTYLFHLILFYIKNKKINFENYNIGDKKILYGK